jgi:hypothetical protein
MGKEAKEGALDPAWLALGGGGGRRGGRLQDSPSRLGLWLVQSRFLIEQD